MRLSGVLDGSERSESKTARVFRLLILHCQGKAKNLLHARTTAETTGTEAWKILCNHYEAATIDRLAALHEKLAALEPTNEPDGVARFINAILETRSLINQVDRNENPSDSAIYGKIRRHLKADLLAYSDILDHDSTITEFETKIDYLLRKAQAQSRSKPAHHQAFSSQTHDPARYSKPGPRRSDYRQQTSDESTNPRQNKRAPGPPRKVFKCQYHRTDSHTTQECRAVKEMMMEAKATQANTTTPITCLLSPYRFPRSQLMRLYFISNNSIDMGV